MQHVPLLNKYCCDLIQDSIDRPVNKIQLSKGLVQFVYKRT